MAKKKILFMSDDLRMSSGVGTMSREIVIGTLKEFDWVQVAGAIKHPDNNKVVAFCKDGEITNGTKSALEYCEKINKKYVILD